ncbi:helix-turn-helix transcriptional regulator [Cupriavidus sp. YAF13]|uniref:helix-turn-helix transcriptional regulator n=1 Tax=Cupriavidus sp. YAF13 TaxID=3233075 RepID=UPI003F8F50F1
MPKLNTIYTSSGPILTTKNKPARSAAVAQHSEAQHQAATNEAKPPEAQSQGIVLPRDGFSRFKQLQPFLPVSRETWRKLTRDGLAPAPQKWGGRRAKFANGGQQKTQRALRCLGF